MPEVTIYTRNQCRQCTQTKNDYIDAGIKPNLIDLTTVPDTQLQTWREKGMLTAPIVDFNGEQWSGYRPTKIEESITALNSMKVPA